METWCREVGHIIAVAVAVIAVAVGVKGGHGHNNGNDDGNEHGNLWKSKGFLCSLPHGNEKVSLLTSGNDIICNVSSF